MGTPWSAESTALPPCCPFRATLEDLSNLEIAYSPPFASALDIVNAAANTAENILDGYNKPMDVDEFENASSMAPLRNPSVWMSGVRPTPPLMWLISANGG